MGLLDRFFGQGQEQGALPGGQQQQGIPADSWWDRFRAEYAPGAAAAHQQSLQQQALYSAMLQNGATPEMARGFARSPQLLGMGGEAYLPSAAQTEWKQDPYTGQWGAYATGRGRGGEPYVKEVPIGGPGTTTNPTEAAQGARPQTPTPQGTPQQPQQPVSNRAGGDIAALVEDARAQGADPETLIRNFVPLGIQNQVRALRSGKMLPDQLKGQTAENVKRMVQLVDPDWNETKAAAANSYIKDYMSGSTRDSVNAINTSLDALDKVIERGSQLHNKSLWFSGASSALNKARQMGGENAETAHGFDVADRALAQSLFKLMSGSKRYSKPAVEEFQKELGSGMRPQEMAGAANAHLDEIIARIDELEKERNDRVGSAQDYPVKPPDFDQKIAALRQKIQQLHGNGGGVAGTVNAVAGAVNPIGTAVYNAIKGGQSGGLPAGWKLVQ